MKANLIDIFLIISVVLGCLLIITACFRIIFKNQSIDRPKITWLVVSLVLVVLPVGGNITIEYGELKILIQKLDEQNKGLERDLSALEEENASLLEQTTSVISQIENYRNIVADPALTDAERQSGLDNINEEVSALNHTAVQSRVNIDSAIMRNQRLREELEPFQRKKWLGQDE